MSKVATVVGLGFFFLLLATPEGQALAKSMLQSTALRSTDVPTNGTVPVIAGDGSVGSDFLAETLMDIAWLATGIAIATAVAFVSCFVYLCFYRTCLLDNNERQSLLPGPGR